MKHALNEDENEIYDAEEAHCRSEILIFEIGDETHMLTSVSARNDDGEIRGYQSYSHSSSAGSEKWGFTPLFRCRWGE